MSQESPLYNSIPRNKPWSSPRLIHTLAPHPTLTILKYNSDINPLLGESLESPHLSVLKNEVLEIFAPLSEGYFIDCTLGFGGHSEAILKAHPKLSLIGIDQDPHALEFSQKRLAPSRIALASERVDSLKFSPRSKSSLLLGFLRILASLRFN